MGFLEEIDKKGREKERARSQKDMKNLLTFLQSYETDGIEEVLSEIHELVKSGYYKKLMEAFKSEAYAKGKEPFTINELNHVRILKLARENLHFGGLFNTIFTPSLMTAKQFVTIYSFMEYTHYLNTHKTSTREVLINLYFSKLDERIIFTLNHFDKVKLEELPKPTKKYFKNLKKLKWKNKRTNELYDKLREFMREIKIFILNYPDINQVAGWISTYWVTEDLFIQTLAGCNAVNNDRQEIEDQDIIIAYKTLFKLIKTDVTKYKAIPELVQGINGYQPSKSGGYLVCEKCYGYYQLQPGESPDDFSDTCECGDHLIYKNDLDY
ncbi:MAG TPA: hypothetical protein HA271_03790 [Methanobacterium subterraneum]|uniref:Uncharacterized protein n=1 Tax=Methanobacterium subterraneum TaxID=59277 RepID=A0A7J4TK75_9EURY|nr:hypothetical protein [Methanobacterium subterraneum]